MCVALIIQIEERVTGYMQRGGGRRRLSIPRDQQIKGPNPMFRAEKMLNKFEFLWIFCQNMYPGRQVSRIRHERRISQQIAQMCEREQAGFPEKQGSAAWTRRHISIPSMTTA